MNNLIHCTKTRDVSTKFRRRAVAPIIATLLLVAIAVVGGSMIFVFAQEFFGDSQISGSPSVELVKITGYDARDVSQVKAHDGIEILPNDCCGESDGGDLLKDPAPTIQPGETVTILVDLDQPFNIPRDTQFKLTTTKGAVFVSTIIMGQDKG